MERYIQKVISIPNAYDKLVDDITESIHVLMEKIKDFRDVKNKDVNQCIKASGGAMSEGDFVYVLTDNSLYCWINGEAFLVRDQFTDIKI